jgi:hypothetical protein
MGEIHEALVKDVACGQVRGQQDIGLARQRVAHALVPGGFDADGVVQGVGSAHAAARQFAAAVHFHQGGGVHGGRHFRVDLLGLAQDPTTGSGLPRPGPP